MKRVDAFWIGCLFFFLGGVLLTQAYVSSDLTLVAIEAGAYKPSDFPNYERRHVRPATSSVVAIIAEKAFKAGVDPIAALKIAKCESRYIPTEKNKSSSASGLYQFIDKTWNKYCTGNRFNAEDNIDCFLILYKKYPNWWVCKA